MRKISIWASCHKWSARIIIVVSYIILNIVAFSLGDELGISGFTIPSLWIYMLSFIAVVTFIVYPLKRNKTGYKNFYQIQKICDLLLVSAGFLLLVALGNHYNLSTTQSPFSFTYAGATNIATTTSTSSNVIEPSSKKKGSLIKQWKQKLKENIRKIRKEYKDASPGERTALIIVTILVAIILLYLVAALSCNISCSGNDAAAVIVLILGTGLIVFLAVRVIKRINRGGPKKPKTEPKEVNSQVR